MDYDVISEIGVLNIPITPEARARIQARLFVLWQGIRPESEMINRLREQDLQSLCAGVQLTLVEGNLRVSFPENLRIAWNYFKLGSFSHKAIPNLEPEILRASQE